MIDNTILPTDEWLTTSDYGLSFSHPIISSGIWFETLFSIKTYLTTSKGCYFLFFVLQYKLPFFLPDLFILTTQTSCQTQQRRENISQSYQLKHFSRCWSVLQLLPAMLILAKWRLMVKFLYFLSYSSKHLKIIRHDVVIKFQRQNFNYFRNFHTNYF